MIKKVFIPYLFYCVALIIYFGWLYPLETYGDTRYAAYMHALFFMQLPLTVLLLFFVWKQKLFMKWIDRHSRYEWIKALVFAFCLAFLDLLIHLPFRIMAFFFMTQEGVRNQSPLNWVTEMFIETLLFALALTVIIYIARIFMAKYKRAWGIILWVVSVPVVLFIMYIQPVWLDPLFDEFQPLPEGILKEEILSLTNEAGLEDAANGK